jgi:outer membrane protein TolC
MTRMILASLMLATARLLDGPEAVRPDLPVPPSWPAGDAYLRRAKPTLPQVAYREIFRDQRLQSLIDQALANNRDLRIAAANIAAARAQYRIQRADQLPQIDAGARTTYSDNECRQHGHGEYGRSRQLLRRYRRSPRSSSTCSAGSLRSAGPSRIAISPPKPRRGRRA